MMMAQDSYSVRDVSIVIPTLNAAAFLRGCLGSIPAECEELLVVDGGSVDETVELAEEAGATVVHTVGTVAAARATGIMQATKPWVLLLDSDVILPEDGVTTLLREVQARSLTALQARLHSISTGSGYWGRALAAHHNSGKASSEWFSFAAALCDRAALLQEPFDSRLRSGEDLDLVYRFRKSGARLAISDGVVGLHRYGDSFQSAYGQWVADGHGLVAIVRKHGLRVAWLLALPLAAGVRGCLLSLRSLQFQWLPYYVCFTFFNYAAMVDELLQGRSRRARWSLPQRVGTGRGPR
jgi:mycofactocin glycosyltransferase